MGQFSHRDSIECDDAARCGTCNDGRPAPSQSTTQHATVVTMGTERYIGGDVGGRIDNPKREVAVERTALFVIHQRDCHIVVAERTVDGRKASHMTGFFDIEPLPSIVQFEPEMELHQHVTVHAYRNAMHTAQLEPVILFVCTEEIGMINDFPVVIAVYPQSARADRDNPVPRGRVTGNL